MISHKLIDGERFFWVTKSNNNQMVVYTDICGNMTGRASLCYSVNQLRSIWPGCKYFCPLGSSTTYDVSSLSNEELDSFLRQEVR